MYSNTQCQSMYHEMHLETNYQVVNSSAAGQPADVAEERMYLQI